MFAIQKQNRIRNGFITDLETSPELAHKPPLLPSGLTRSSENSSAPRSKLGTLRKCPTNSKRPSAKSPIHSPKWNLRRRPDRSRYPRHVPPHWKIKPSRWKSMPDLGNSDLAHKPPPLPEMPDKERSNPIRIIF